ncbi:MAG: hypothetical protein UHT92_06870 [Prevotella sp.]|nr:hypothetical protein [Prevotella sp.]
MNGVRRHPGGKKHRVWYALKGQTLSVHSSGQDEWSKAAPWGKYTPRMIRHEGTNAKRT